MVLWCVNSECSDARRLAGRLADLLNDVRTQMLAFVVAELSESERICRGWMLRMGEGERGAR